MRYRVNKVTGDMRDRETGERGTGGQEGHEGQVA